jgi:hypothetical protein
MLARSFRIGVINRYMDEVRGVPRQPPAEALRVLKRLTESISNITVESSNRGVFSEEQVRNNFPEGPVRDEVKAIMEAWEHHLGVIADVAAMLARVVDPSAPAPGRPDLTPEDAVEAIESARDLNRRFVAITARQYVDRVHAGLREELGAEAFKRLMAKFETPRDAGGGAYPGTVTRGNDQEAGQPTGQSRGQPGSATGPERAEADRAGRAPLG